MNTASKQHMHSWVRPLVAIVILGAVLVVLGFFSDSPQYSLGAGSRNMKSARAQFESDIKEFGGKKAYDRLAVAVHDLGIDDQHGYAHAFGHELYKIEGESGIAVCDVRFGMGCFHQFLGNAIEDLGTSSVQRLFEKCGTASGSTVVCEHGLGHGIVSGLGYTEADLRAALTLCDSVTHNNLYASCSGGAFMEYNMRTIASAEGILGTREAEHQDMYAPCGALDEAQKKTCTFWLPEWWYFAIIRGMPGTTDDAYARMGTWCAQSPSPQSCYEGIGYITPTVFGFDPIRAREACTHVGDRGDGDVYCRGMAALILHITDGHQSKSPLLCEGLSEHGQDICLQYAMYSGNNFSFTVPAQHSI